MEIGENYKLKLITKNMEFLYVNFENNEKLVLSPYGDFDESNVYIPYEDLQEFCDIILNKAIELGKVKVGK